MPASRPALSCYVDWLHGFAQISIASATIMLFVLLASSGVEAKTCEQNEQHSDSKPAAAPYYDFGTSNETAQQHYRRGWIEILQYGRWMEAERQYRLAVAADPNFFIAKSVLGRITSSKSERAQLYSDVERHSDLVDDAGQLLLRTYQRTLELFELRESGNPIPEGFREDMAAIAERDYAQFLKQYPDEYSVNIEYIEWVHARRGPAAALEEVERLNARDVGRLSFSYFPAYFHAELGNFEVAHEMAHDFARAMDETAPQPHYLRAFIAFKEGDLLRAQHDVERALGLDDRHLLAERLRAQIEAALRDHQAGATTAGPTD